jgi:hypothetical protein
MGIRNIVAFGTKNPRRNLPLEVRNKRAEIIFQATFLRTYLDGFVFDGIGGNQFEMPGYGIADFIWAMPDGKIDAFEFKISDWKKGVGQAARYRSYATRSFLVLPVTVASRIVEHIKTFQSINLGLWAFDSSTKSIEKYVTPTETPPLNSQAQATALKLLGRKLKFRKFAKSI